MNERTIIRTQDEAIEELECARATAIPSAFRRLTVVIEWIEKMEAN